MRLKLSSFSKTAVFAFTIFLAAILVLSTLACFAYTGQKTLYILFSLTFNALLLMGFRKGKFFFDTFLGVFLWLGFWLKTTVRVIFFKGFFTEAVGLFDQSPKAFDRGLTVCIIGGLALCSATLVREYLLKKNLHSTPASLQPALDGFYLRHRKLLLSSFIFLFLIISSLNLVLGIYQRGTASHAQLPPGFHGTFTWLLMFGLSSASAIFLDIDIRLGKGFLSTLLIAFAEIFTSNVSMMSRGFVLNAGALAYGCRDLCIRLKKSIAWPIQIFVPVAFCLFFYGSFVFVANMRSAWFFKTSNPSAAGSLFSESYRSDLKPEENAKIQNSMQGVNRRLFMDRWVGIEGVLAVSSYNDLGWDLWRRAWAEKYQDYGTSLFDREIGKTDNASVSQDLHFINMPGSIGFFFYPGSYVFLFFTVFFAGLGYSLIEYLTFKTTGNIVLCSLFGQVLAYRFAHFGYVPAQTYLLVGSVLLNIGIVVLIRKSAASWAKRKR
jgi:hypothetical protein